jgi:Na+/H+ antiporter NhaC
MSETGTEPLRFRGGTFGVFAPFGVFLAGVAWLGLSGAPDERGFWPVVLAALVAGMLLVRDRDRFTREVVAGMSRPIVAIMVLAWLLAGVLGRVLQESGFVESLIGLATAAGLGGRGYVGASFAICCVVSTATGTSLGTLLVCGPLLYPAGGPIGASPAVLMGAILGGATFGDNLSPISDTTIASAYTQEARIAGVVRSRLRYALFAGTIALALYLYFGGASTSRAALPVAMVDRRALAMLLVPAIVLSMLWKGRTLLEGLLAGIVLSIGLGVVLGLVRPDQLFRVEAGSFSAGGLLLEGMNRGVGASIFTLLLMGLVGPLEASGTLDRLVRVAARRIHSPRSAEIGIVAVTTAAVLLTTHSTVALLTVGDFARRTGERFGISRYRRANLMDITVCVFPFVLPYMIPTIIAASTTSSGEGFGMPRLSPFAVGIDNFHSWALLLVLLVAVATGFGRKQENDEETALPPGASGRGAR